jgi:hypothetical protein
MKKILTNTPRFLLALALVGGIISCDKTKGLSVGNRKQLVKLMDGAVEIKVVARDVLPNMETFDLVDLRREPNDEAQLFTPLVVKLQLDPTIITAYNSAHGTHYIPLPASFYTLSEDLNGIGFEASEFAKTIKISLDKTNFDLSAQYALGFRIIDAGTGAAINPDLETALYSIGVKNEYDGVYKLDGKFYHPTQSPGYDPFTVTVELHTSGPNSVKLYVPDFGGYYSPGLFGGSLNAFAAQEPAITVNPATNVVTVQNAFVGAVTFYDMSVGYNSRYDPATKKIYAKWGYSWAVPGVWDPNCREWEDVFTYLGPR